MAYTANIKTFKKNPTTGNNNGSQQRPFTRLVTVLGYDLEKKEIMVEDGAGRKFKAHVKKDTFDACERSLKTKKMEVSAIKWMGHDINEKMESAVPVGSKCILASTLVLKKDDGTGYAIAEMQRVKGVPNPDPYKTYEGVFTVESFYDKESRSEYIGRAQCWREVAIDINNDVEIQKLAKDIDEASENYGKKVGKVKVTVPTLGVQFRTLVKTDESNEAGPVYQAINASIPFDWMRSENKADSHLLSGEEFLSMCDGYVDYISNAPEFKEMLENDQLLIDVAVYRNMPASVNDQLRLTFDDPEKDKHASKNPLHSLSHRKSFVDMEQTEQLMGKNYAVKGIIQISANKIEKVNGKLEEIPSYWVTQLHAENPIKGHIFSFVRTEGGHKVKPHPMLDLEKTFGKEDAPANQTPSQGQNQNSNSGQSAEKPSAKPQESMSDDSDDFSPFGLPTPKEEESPKEVSKERIRFGKKS